MSNVTHVLVVPCLKAEKGSKVKCQSRSSPSSTSGGGGGSGSTAAASIDEDMDSQEFKSYCHSTDTITMDLYSNDTKDTLGGSSRAGSPSFCDGGQPQEMFCTSTVPGDSCVSSVEDGKAPGEAAAKRPCLVCGDDASGYHYGVASCEACKAFFKRTIQGNIEYTCPAANRCEINKRRRKACQACRFQKCISQGMLREGVRLDRVRGGRQKYRKSTDSAYQASPIPAKKISLEDNKFISALVNCEPEPLMAHLDVEVSTQNLKTVAILSDLMDRELVATIGWAKQIPGFTDLTLNDQMRLLQTAWAEILCLSLAFRSRPPGDRIGSGGASSVSMHFAPNLHLREHDVGEVAAEDLFSNLLQLVHRLSVLKVAREEFLALKALLLTNSDTQLEDSSSVQELREVILSALHDCVSAIHGGNCPSACSLHVGQLLLCLPLLRQLDSDVRRFWNAVRQDGKIPMNKLFVEMLESHLPLR